MKRILAIDGGGIRGVLPASMLAVLEDAIGESVADFFDLIVGTSTGGIVALGLANGVPASDVRDFYVEHGPTVFRGPRLPRKFRHWTLGKYNADGLRTALETVFGDKRLGESTTRVVVPALSLETGEVHLYKTSHHPKFERDYKERIVDVAMATAAAPTYLPAHISQSGMPLVDGGVFANNPAGLAAVEAVGVLDWPRGDFRLLSVGCGSEALAVGRGRHWNLGRLYWASKLADVFMAAQSSSSMGTAHLLAGHDRVERLNPRVAGGRFGLDAVDEIPALRGLGEAEARRALPKLRETFFDRRADSFEPYRR